MPIDVSIDTKELEAAIVALKDVENKDIAPEFQKAAEQTVRYLSRDLQRGVAQVSGDLRASIIGDVKQVTGANVDMDISDRVTHKGYDYAGRLDKDGSLRWRSGKFKGRRTFGWFSYSLRRNAPKAVKRYFKAAVETVVNKISMRLKTK